MQIKKPTNELVNDYIYTYICMYLYKLYGINGNKKFGEVVQCTDRIFPILTFDNDVLCLLKT